MRNLNETAIFCYECNQEVGAGHIALHEPQAMPLRRIPWYARGDWRADWPDRFPAQVFFYDEDD